MKLKIYETNGKWYWSVKGKNGRKVALCAEGNGVVSKGNAKKAWYRFRDAILAGEIEL